MTPPFTIAGWILGRIADRTELLHVYLQKLKHAKSAEDRMLAHAELMKMQMEKYLAVAKEVNIVLEMADTLFGSAIQMFRHKRLYEEMARNSTELEKQTDKTIEERLIAIERQLSGSPRLVRGVKP